MSKYYPLCLNLKEKKCLIVGAGDVAERKVKGFLGTEAKIFVVSPVINPGLLSLKKKGFITCLEETFQPRHLSGVFIVIGATDSSKTNLLVYEEAQKKKILVNIVDYPEKCNIIIPAVVERGDLSISISTNGKSPALSGKIKKEIAQLYTSEYSIFLEIMGEIRDNIIHNFPSQKNRRKIFSAIVHDAELLNIIKKEGKEPARKKILTLLDQYNKT